MFRDLNHQVLYTDAAFKQYGDSFGYLLAQVPYHRSGRFLPSFLMGMIPEWRGWYSSTWVKKHLSKKFSSVYAFIYSTDCMKYAHWVAKKRKIPLIVHLADHSPEFEQTPSRKILRSAKKSFASRKK